MENTEKKSESITVELSTEQYAFLTNWQKIHEQELGIEVPLSAMVRKAVDIAMKSQAKREERPGRDGRDDRGGRGDDRGGRPGGRPSFGASRPAPGRGGPKFSMMGARNKTRSFDK